MAVSKLVLAVLLALPLIALSADHTYKAQMNGASVVPNPVNTEQTGTAQFEFHRHTIRESTVDVTVTLTRYVSVTSVQLKYGPPGGLDKNGGPTGTDLLAYIFGPSNQSPNGPIKKTLTRNDLLGGLRGKPINDLQQDVDDRMVYVLVTTSRNPQGALRGQVAGS